MYKQYMLIMCYLQEKWEVLLGVPLLGTTLRRGFVKKTRLPLHRMHLVEQTS